MSEWLSVMRTDEVVSDDRARNIYIKKLEKLVYNQEKMLKLNRDFRYRYIKYLERLNRALFAENTRLKKEIYWFEKSVSSKDIHSLRGKMKNEKV